MAAVKTHLHDVAAFLEDLSEHRLDERRALIEFLVGNEFTGFTDLEVLAAGRIRLESTVTRGLDLFWRTARVSPGSVERLVRSLRANEVWRIQPSRTAGFADEPRVNLALRYGSERWATTFWLHAVDGDQRWIGIREELWRIVRRVSRGAVLQIDP